MARTKTTDRLGRYEVDKEQGTNLEAQNKMTSTKYVRKGKGKQKQNTHADIEDTTIMQEVDKEQATNLEAQNEVDKEQGTNLEEQNKVSREVDTETILNKPSQQKERASTSKAKPTKRRKKTANKTPPFLLDRSKWLPQQKILVGQNLHVMIAIVEKLLSQNKCLEMFRDGVFGHFLNFTKVKEFPARIMHHAIMRIIRITDTEIRFLFGKKILTFGPQEFGIISGLKCSDVDDIFSACTTFTSKDQHTFRETYFPGHKNIKTENIMSVFMTSKNIPDEDLVKLANLYFLEAVLLPKNFHYLIDMKHVHLLEDMQEFNDYPWGTVVLKETIKHIRSAVVHNQTGNNPLPQAYHLDGFPYILLAFLYETIPLLEINGFCARGETQYVQRVLNWEFIGRPNWNELEKQVFESKDLVLKYLKPTAQEKEQQYMQEIALSATKDAYMIDSESESAAHAAADMPSSSNNVLHEVKEIRAIQEEMRKQLNEVFVMLKSKQSQTSSVTPQTLNFEKMDVVQLDALIDQLQNAKQKKIFDIEQQQHEENNEQAENNLQQDLDDQDDQHMTHEDIIQIDQIINNLAQQTEGGRTEQDKGKAKEPVVHGPQIASETVDEEPQRKSKRLIKTSHKISEPYTAEFGSSSPKPNKRKNDEKAVDGEKNKKKK